MLHISIAPDILFHIGSLPITNTILTSSIFIVLFSIKLRDKNSTLVFFVRFILTKLYELFLPILKDKTTIFFPYVASLFLFILFSNWLGLLPGVGSITFPLLEHNVPLLKAATADLNTTIGLAILTVLIIQGAGLKYL